MAQNAPRDENDVPALLGTSNVDGTPVTIYADPVTHRLLVGLGSSAGTVTSVSVVSANGFAGTVATATTTPAITLTTTITGLLKGNGTAISTATAGTDYQAPITLTTTGTSGVATFIANTLNIPNYTTSGGTPGGLNAQIQYNNAGAFGGITNATTDGTSVSLNAAHLLNPTINGAGAGLATLAYPNTATSVTVTLPIATDTLVGKATTDTLTNKTFNTAGTGNSFSINGTAITAVNGTGAVTLTTSPAFVTPSLGVATATSINGNTFTTGTYTLTGTAAKTLNFTNTLTLSGTDSTTMTFPSTSATIARTDSSQTFISTQTFSNGVNLNGGVIQGAGSTVEFVNALTLVTSFTVSANAITLPDTTTNQTITNNAAAAVTITLSTSGFDGKFKVVRFYDFTGVAQTLTWVNTENSTVNVPSTSNGSTTLPVSICFQYNSATSKWRCVAVS